MEISDKISAQKLLKAFKNLEISHVVISPGSRNAPLTLSFSEDPYFSCFSVVDERSAGFVALGMAQQLQKPVAVCCTSGSALVNYYPAVVEAFYQNLPLIVLSADRPLDKVDQFEGQTIRQNHLFKTHLGESFVLNQEEETQDYANLLAFLNSKIDKKTPCHINLPFSEPLYGMIPIEDSFKFENQLIPEKSLEKSHIQEEKMLLTSKMLSEFEKAKKILVLVGMQNYNAHFCQKIEILTQDPRIVVLKETTSNLKAKGSLGQIDNILSGILPEKAKDYAPDLLITLGQNVISKKIKAFLRSQKAQFHWHIDPFWSPNTYGILSDSLCYSASDFLSELTQKAVFQKDEAEKNTYASLWKETLKARKKINQKFLSTLPYSDLWVHYKLKKQIPENYILQYANSSVVRYGQLFASKNIVYSNRGTSGIDGSSSTAVGFSILNPNPTLLISGDIGFMYDINALWNNYLPSHFKIIVFNNGGGNIFKIIQDGTPKDKMETYFETAHQKKLKKIAEHFGLNYLKIDSKKGFDCPILLCFRLCFRPE
ncbi:MAG: 2-succinyl-5-enolpyruvyl-6-hydroxy-3-cyclohexene-1-carboxylic-acid synthase [Flavobacteriaceae bacterium]|nr:MAG: 2-succinyl-5-enolpyruvyl-6-hydroxy-3-cyclohexene-1-carboxylic-acid synthase [Flavobacteriaceae bacterium]